jgi:calcineurin-like phosphoesterase family protein
MGWQSLIIDNWRRIIKDEDIVIHHGDFGFGKIEPLQDILRNLTGKIIIVRGNHDRSRRVLEDMGFASVLSNHDERIVVKDDDCGDVEYVCVTRSEEPRDIDKDDHVIAVSHQPYENIWSHYFWGHTHNNPLAWDDKGKLFNFSRSGVEGRNLSIEMTNYLPVPLPVLLYDKEWIEKHWKEYSAWYFRVDDIKNARTKS